MDGKLLLAIPVLIVKMPLLAIKYIATHRILLITAIVGIGILVAVNVFKGDDKQTQVQIPEYQRILPEISKAPRIVQTTTRYYPYATSIDSKDTMTLTDYYYYTDKKWEHSTKPLLIEKTRIYKIYTRSTGG
jgi:hypothetical protein